ncbi:hypothetical protein [Absidia glauca]|uniref:F-box domain-containing protein n=1 Tax=Absidia glauca TaxID=4829 RepID=A0A168LXH8_ABSGL|nr:hypothetical protein [Absidia glauca]
MSYLSDAPIEVLHLMLYNIDRQCDLYECALVNKSFYAAANPLLWREPQQMVSDITRECSMPFRLLQSFRQARKHGIRSTTLGHHIRKLYIQRRTHLQDLRQLINNAPLLEELVIHSTLKDKDLERIVLKCPQLKRLSLYYLMAGSDRFFESLRHCTNLREFNIMDSCRSTYELTSLKHCRLEKLKIQPFLYSHALFLEATFDDMPTLTHLDLDCIATPYFRHYRTLRSPTLFPALTDLRIAMLSPESPADDTLVSFFKAHPLIRNLSIEGMKINPAIMDSLAIDLVHLKRLSLINNGHLPPLTIDLLLVEKLTVRACHTNASFIVHLAHHFPNLHYIHVGKYDYSRWQPSINYIGNIVDLVGSLIEVISLMTYLDFASHDSVPGDLKVHLPRRMGGKLVQEDLEHIRQSAVGLAWID